MRRIIFFHVPKCGGSSFGAALRLRYFYNQAVIDLSKSGAAVAALYPDLRADDRIEADYQFRFQELRRLMVRGVRCIGGHVQYRPDLRDHGGHDYAFVTLLRHPVDRFISHYFYLQRRHPDPTRPKTLEAFLDTPDAARLGSQYLFYFGGHSWVRSTDPARAVRRARAALAGFDLVGDLSDPSGFVRELRRLVGGPLPLLHRNRAPHGGRVPASVRARVAAVCAPDLAIWDAAQQRHAA